ncbi:MAG: HEPN domain-containing protein [Candidatus Hydrothermarchaeales archaeon]
MWLLDEAHLLLEEAESKLRSAMILYEKGEYGDAISRAYYSMHYSARALLSTKNIFPKTHKGVIAQFGLEFVKKGVVEDYYVKIISTARESRERADYGIGYEFTEEEAEDIIHDADRLLERIRRAIEDLAKD